MQADFLDAHQRHWDDAERLYGDGRWANADHSTDWPSRRPWALDARFWHAFRYNEIGPPKSEDATPTGHLGSFEAYRCGHHRGVSYGLPASNPFDDWHVSQRYAHQSHFDQARAQGHQNGRGQACALINKARRRDCYDDFDQILAGRV